MKRTIKNITLAVVITTVASSAHAAWTDTVKGYWNSACTQAKSAAQAVQAMPESVSNWCSNTYFFSTNKLDAIWTKINAGTASKEEYEVLANVIRASTLPANTKNVLVSTLKRHAQKQNVEAEEMQDVYWALVSIESTLIKNIVKISAYTAAAATGIAMIYAYKRLTARPSIPGWCA